MILLSFAYAKLSSIIPPPRKCQERISEISEKVSENF